MVELSADERASALCVSCGFCCDGTLFNHGDIEEGDKHEGMKVAKKSNGVDAFHFPCPSHDGACTNYEGRPTLCRSFFCSLAKELRDGKISLDRALQIQTDAKVEFAYAREMLDPGEGTLPQAVDAFLTSYRSRVTDIAFVKANGHKIMAARRYQKAKRIFVPRKSLARRLLSKLLKRPSDPLQ